MTPDRPARHQDQRVALVTGANRGIGLEVCRQLAAVGYTVVLGSRDPAKGETAAEELSRRGTGGDQIRAQQLDVTDGESVERLQAWVEAEFGRLDALVNNAAINYDAWQRAETAELRVVRETLDANTLGPWRVTQAFAPLLRRAGARGRVVNVSSEAGSLAGMRTGGTPAYGVSKAALNAVTRLFAAELHPAGVLVNAVCPGWVATDMGGAGGRPVEQGAASVVWGVTLPDGGPTGGFFRDGKPLPW
jgi:NAD(P)-dependent dehydrogenase (short-subunit alcohol dehydrogenase family)